MNSVDDFLQKIYNEYLKEVEECKSQYKDVQKVEYNNVQFSPANLQQQIP